MYEVVRAVAPLALALYLLVGPIPVHRGEAWFKKKLEQNLSALGVKQPSRPVDDIWNDARLASEPRALAARALVTILAVWLLIPRGWSGTWLACIGVFALVLGAFATANWLHPRASKTIFGRERPIHQLINAMLILVVIGASALKLIY